MAKIHNFEDGIPNKPIDEIPRGNFELRLDELIVINYAIDITRLLSIEEGRLFDTERYNDIHDKIESWKLRLDTKIKD